MLPGETNRGFGHVDMSKIVYERVFFCFYDNMKTIHVVEFVDNIIFHKLTILYWKVESIPNLYDSIENFPILMI